MNRIAAHAMTVSMAALAWVAAPSLAAAACSLFDDAPCNPSFCSIESLDSCEPDVFYRPSDIDEIAIHSGTTGAELAEINSPADAARHLRACWKPPQGAAFDGLLMDVRFAFDRRGALRMSPHIVFFTPDAPEAAQIFYGLSIREAINRCSPLPFSARYGASMGERLLAVRFIVDKK